MTLATPQHSEALSEGLTLDQFEQEVQRDIAAFFAHWRRMNAKRPDMFPLSFPERDAGNWHEQLIIFLSDPEAAAGLEDALTAESLAPAERDH